MEVTTKAETETGEICVYACPPAHGMISNELHLT